MADMESNTNLAAGPAAAMPAQPPTTGHGPAPSTAPAAGGMVAGMDVLQKPDSREARIQARRARIDYMRTANAKSTQENPTARRPKKDLERVEPSKSVVQIKASKERITTVKRKGVEDASQVRITTIHREQKRRNDETHRAETLSQKAKRTSESSDDLERQIQEAWAKCVSMSQSLGTPFDLHEMIVSQRKLCEQLLNAKENLLVEYNAELKRKDDEYVKELKRQADEIDMLLMRMDQQFVTFKKSLREELVHIERAFMMERGETIDKNIKEIEALFQSRKDSEMRYLEERSKRIQDNTDALEELRVQDAEEYNLVKIKLETDVQVLEQQLQQMKATYQLNTEKLEYNYQVLKKRDDENSITINQQKRRITRMTDIVNNLRAKLAKQEKHFASDYAALQEDFNRISSQYQELTKKFKHFQVNDEVKFQELWEMNQDTIKNLASKVLMADAVIHQQQLGLPWEPPVVVANDVMPKGIGGGSQRQSPAVAQGTGGSGSNNGGAAGGEGDRDTHEQAQPSTLPPPTADTNPTLHVQSSQMSNSSITTLLLSSKNAIVQHILDMLSTEATFLLDDKLSRLLAPLPASERALLKLDTVLKALDVTSAADLVRFLELFLLPKFHGSAPDLAAAVIHGTTDPLPVQADGTVPPNEDPAAMLIHPNQVTKVLMRYLKEKRGRTRGGEGGGANRQAGLANDEDRPDTTTTDGVVPSNDMNVQQTVKEHWDQILAMLNSNRFKNWDTILSCMEAYHLLLGARHDLALEVSDLETQNDELKTLLREYMSADVNKSLQVPPSQVILSQIQQQQQLQQTKLLQKQQQHLAASPSPVPQIQSPQPVKPQQQQAGGGAKGGMAA
ncbi:sperm tail-domain-containing protein [Catenaria anguillulae PL171]|uniref:Sperm tail-domain-containing protein n=1 Tax=Catenaria anguillulae PL171 TaxID=765915 RepID=A0A1Y2HDP3_9FUNG|nr:sperm tail-domain-containing protein [Catenaria anguillulae PL171]